MNSHGHYPKMPDYEQFLKEWNEYIRQVLPPKDHQQKLFGLPYKAN